MLRTRILTALVLLAMVAVAASISVQALVALGAVFLAVTLAEWLCLSGIPVPAAYAVALLAGGAALAGELSGMAPSAGMLQALCALACLAWLSIAVGLTRAQRGPVHISRWLLVVLALVLAGVAWLALAALLQRGPGWTVSVLVVVWLADIAAYFSGRAFGVRKLASRISPGKTWAGVWGALIAVVAVGEIVSRLWPEAPFWSTQLLRAAPVAGVFVLLVLVALSIVGDLFESLVKRQAGVKDSGWILPGHGGVWDRIDATLPVLPLAVLAQSVMLPGGFLG
jgi:phosphatidate cytidylyltransferase